MNVENFCCPHCGSDNVESVKLLYEEGHFTVKETKNEIIGYSERNRVTTYSDGSTKTEHLSSTPIYGNVERTVEKRTMLAQRLEPPIEPKRQERETFWFEKIISFLYGIFGVYSFIIWGILIIVLFFGTLGSWLFHDFHYALEYAINTVVSFGKDKINSDILYTINSFSAAIYPVAILTFVRHLIRNSSIVRHKEGELDNIYNQQRE